MRDISQISHLILQHIDMAVKLLVANYSCLVSLQLLLETRILLLYQPHLVSHLFLVFPHASYLLQERFLPYIHHMQMLILNLCTEFFLAIKRLTI